MPEKISEEESSTDQKIAQREKNYTRFVEDLTRELDEYDNIDYKSIASWGMGTDNIELVVRNAKNKFYGVLVLPMSEIQRWAQLKKSSYETYIEFTAESLARSIRVSKKTETDGSDG